ncbi:HNH endonuclease signature motif containing protein [Pseudonocardia kunmingensis]|uniref:HNH endonuclease n=1 Tax=Pseudonocardia kunmingensis TaxID=630975 RepID=A0A543DRI7_9PSEU|nr:HNH endonuclease signature motif containing protein [Pseudonocardia kunmingensis]TQM11938.1 HNH endonuclease [Pseudonocardia kunmingensis]
MPVLALPTPQTTDIRVLETELLSLAGHINAALCQFLRVLAEFDDREGWAGPGIRSCAHWLSWRAGMSLRTAIDYLRVAHALPRLPRITAAFAAGRISYSKVRALTRVVGTDTAALTRIAAAIAAGEPDLRHLTVADPDTAEQVLLNLALSGTASHVETVVAAVRRRHTPPTDTTAQRSLSWHWDTDGSLVLRGRFTPDAGAALIAAIEARMAPRASVSPGPAAPDPATASASPATASPATASPSVSPPDLDQHVLEQEPGPATDRLAARRADALQALITHGPDDVVVARGQAQVIVHLDATTGSARLADGPELPASTAERLACDARVQALLNDRTGNRMYLGRSRRLATPAQIAALTVRDGARCQFPGCSHTRHLHAHHVRPWWAQGRTDIDNLILICSYHHSVIHDHGYRIHRLPDRWQFHRPDGTPIPTTAPALSGNTESLIEMHTRAGLRIDRTTLTPNWFGERLDPEPIPGCAAPTPDPDRGLTAFS